MTVTPLTGADDKARTLFELWPAHDWAGIFATFAPRMAAAFPEAEIPNAWAQIIAQVGELETIADDAYVRVHDIHTVVDVPLEFEAGEMVGRVTFDESGHVAGLFFLNPDAASESESQ
ncbi:DUF3887 domain-containing protein [Gordonia crocea]|uniref:DUF3887 domain-containing protein n=1 Tax=Gordonia crocea TaxID=589162 RepID=A0A7I9UX35_9ACTN|nr:DUF3887 domain-containing protein [Gordonia crocea]GED97350.1 hypothetical protein nbrc107697_13890 [Gordonia crocea]